jgi:hypothetical protein
MGEELTAVPFTFHGRISRSKSRQARDQVAQARVTPKEYEELLSAARGDGRALGEWVREVLLREARRADDDALFTELVATRMLMVNLFKPLIMGKPVSQEWLTEMMAVIRREKRKAAQEVRQQYTDDKVGGQ